MTRDIIFTPNGKDSFLSTVQFIKLKWGDKSADKFVAKTYKTLDTVALQPYIFKTFQGNTVRKGLVSKQTSFVYRVYDDRIEVIFFWDNRQEPIEQ